MKKIAIFGASGFLGSNVAQELLNKGHIVTSFSRYPKESVKNQNWVVADGFQPETYKKHIKNVDSIVISVGSPPVPTFNQQGFDNQVKNNGLICKTIIEEAEKAGVRHIVLIGATMPEWAPSGYLEGKMIARGAAMDFESTAKENGATVLYPAAIYGTRYQEVSAIGMKVPIPLTPLMWPISIALKAAKKASISPWLENRFPFAFKGVLEPMVSVSNVAKAAADAAVNEEFRGRMVELNNECLCNFKN